LAEDISAPVATCPNPKCGKPIPRGPPYSWCAECGEELPAAIQAQLPRLQENTARAATARAALEAKAEPYLADEAEAIAKLYRRLVLLVGIQLLAGFVARSLAVMAAAASETATTLILGLFVILVGLAWFVASLLIVVAAYRLAGRLKAGVPILWALAMFIPCVNIITLLVLSSIAQSWCRRHGIKVGFFGPTKESIEEIRRRSATSVFD
jgi:hypothetical protein